MQRRFRLQTDDSSIEEPFINLTPLIDVVFVVLISFMIIAPVLDIDSVDLAMSGGTEKKEVQPSSLSIIVHPDNSIWFQGSKVSLSQLEALLKEERKKQPRTIPQLIHDRQAQFGTYQSIKNILESIGFEQMDVILKPG